MLIFFNQEGQRPACSLNRLLFKMGSSSQEGVLDRTLDTQTKMYLSTHPPSAEESRCLAKGLFLAGAPLEPPRFHETGWQEGQTFTEQDDPDRTCEAFEVPNFLAKNPELQRAQTRCEDIYADETGTSFIREVQNVFDEEACAELIARINDKGFTPALLNIGRGRQKLDAYARNGHRAIADIPDLSSWIFEVIKPHLPDELYGGKLRNLNERLRFLCYTPGQEFPMHIDGNYVRPADHEYAGDKSRITLQIYLQDVPEENGGMTTFDLRSHGNRRMIPCQPKAGSVVLFTQNLMHEGSLLKSGLKYTIRTEAMYSRKEIY
eukprot:TRINITY_DN99817_c0_g1_i1.p1 TRINITY_DN99817_c0_g1~~TRINITY_DN99817_c0_g1_i1.p1  ORF type:complete len:320 (-),score=34.50 TRINITY_DN99817_c0_g1_i1:62-1021(-)